MSDSSLLKSANIEICNIEYSTFASTIEQKYKDSKIIVFADENTYRFCWNKLLSTFDFLSKAELIVVLPGEENKTLETCNYVWDILADHKVGRHDIFINLGGGLITDMGGFIASTFKRGVKFINIPTTLLGMIDASFGGKTGVNLSNFKNQIGVFQEPIATYIDKSFLHTLPSNHIRNGMAEMIKHALISDDTLWKKLLQIETLTDILADDIFNRSLIIKMKIVNSDPKELGERKILNFGHTVGHALESYFFNFYPIDHGHAVALGIMAESYIATKIKKLTSSEFNQITTFVKKYFVIPSIFPPEIPEILKLLHNDKKNYGGQIQCSIVDTIGHCLYDQAIDEELFSESLTFLFFNEYKT